MPSGLCQIQPQVPHHIWLVHGRELHSPVDLLYSGWVEHRLEKKDVSQWALEVAERVELLRELAFLKQAQTLEHRKAKFDHYARDRELVPKDLVLVRTPGMVSKLDEAWTGPWEVVRKCGPVTYEVRIKEGNRKTKMVHLNTFKKYFDRDALVKHLSVLSEPDTESDKIETWAAQQGCKDRVVVLDLTRKS